MPLTYEKLDLLTVRNGIIAHGCNSQGVMGAGVAEQIARNYPEAYEAYYRICSENRDDQRWLLGRTQFVKIGTLTVANCFTQLNYGRRGVYATIENIESSLNAVFNYSRYPGQESKVYIPKIGCGLGGLDWKRDVEPVIIKLVERTDAEVVVCEL